MFLATPRNSFDLTYDREFVPSSRHVACVRFSLKISSSAGTGFVFFERGRFSSSYQRNTMPTFTNKIKSVACAWFALKKYITCDSGGLSVTRSERGQSRTWCGDPMYWKWVNNNILWLIPLHPIVLEKSDCQRHHPNKSRALRKLCLGRSGNGRGKNIWPKKVAWRSV